MTKQLRRTDAIIQDLRDHRDEQLAAGVPVDVRAVEQEIIAHQELARLREKRAERVAEQDWLAVNDLDTQIQHWLRFVSEDVDETVAENPKKNETQLVDPGPPMTTLPVKPARS